MASPQALPLSTLTAKSWTKAQTVNEFKRYWEDNIPSYIKHSALIYKMDVLWSYHLHAPLLDKFMLHAQDTAISLFTMNVLITPMLIYFVVAASLNPVDIFCSVENL